MHDFERRLCAQTQKLYIIKTFYETQLNPKKLLQYTTFQVQLPYIAGQSL